MNNTSESFLSLRLKYTVCAVVLLALSLCPVGTYAQVTSWVNTDPAGGNWGVAGNWSPASVPTASITTLIGNGGLAILTGDPLAAARAFTVGETTSGNRFEIGTSTLVTRGVVLGNGAGSSGSADIKNGGVWRTNGGGGFSAFVVGTSGTGNLSIESGGSITSGRSRIAVNASSVSEATVRGTWIWDSTESVGFGAGTGILNLGVGGKLELIGTTKTISMTANSTINIGGRVTAEAAGRLNADSINGAGAAPTVNFNHTGTNYIFETEGNTSIVIAGTTKVVQKQGTTVLTATNTYTGSTTVSGGTLLVNGSVGGSGVTVQTAGTLGGSGTVSSLVTVNSGGTLSPGTSPGVATYSGGLTLETASSFTFELAANSTSNRGTDFDGVNVTGGTFSLQSGVNFNLILNGAGSTTNYTLGFWDSDRSWLVFDNANVPTIGALFALGSVSNDSLGNTFSTAAGGLGSFGFSQVGNDIFLNYSVIPEPSTWLLLIGSLTCIVAMRRFRNKRE